MDRQVIGKNLKGNMNNTPKTNAAWGLALLPILLLGLVLSWIVISGGGLRDLTGPPVESLKVQRVTLPQPGMIIAEVVNDGPQDVTIAQVLVDDAFWRFTVQPSTTLARFGKATFRIPYPWVADEAHNLVFLSSTGSKFEHIIPVAVETPRMDWELLLRFALVGLYVGVVPVALGLLWYPFMRRMGARAMNAILALTVGLLVYLAIGTYIDAQEFAAETPIFFQGTPLVVLVAMLTLGAVIALGNRKKLNTDMPADPLAISYRIAFGIGLHNLGEGLAIGAAFANGQAALGTLLILGFTLHNITEGVGIAAPIVRRETRLKHFIMFAMIAGSPAIIGTLVGSYAFDPVLATVFLAIGLGAIIQVIIEVGTLVIKGSQRLGEPVINWINFSGLAAGMAIMYVTAFLVKF